MKNERYAINKYYTLVGIDVNTRVLMERFMVVRVCVDYIFDTFEQEIWADSFDSYKDALDYIEELLELPQAKDGE